MAELLHQLIGSLSHYLQGFYTSKVVVWISAINIINSRILKEGMVIPLIFPTRWWFQIFFIFTPNVGEDSHFD